mmetsp:Transcript_95247/g.246121  ORF Transcript_95247/g.246121 Transcript_95247/m.246121 type:complete len:237 (+) Transcript_95247:951-1661(+)
MLLLAPLVFRLGRRARQGFHPGRQVVLRADIPAGVNAMAIVAPNVAAFGHTRLREVPRSDLRLPEGRLLAPPAPRGPPDPDARLAAEAVRHPAAVGDRRKGMGLVVVYARARVELAQRHHGEGLVAPGGILVALHHDVNPLARGDHERVVRACGHDWDAISRHEGELVSVDPEAKWHGVARVHYAEARRATRRAVQRRGARIRVTLAHQGRPLRHALADGAGRQPADLRGRSFWLV